MPSLWHAASYQSIANDEAQGMTHACIEIIECTDFVSCQAKLREWLHSSKWFEISGQEAVCKLYICPFLDLDDATRVFLVSSCCLTSPPVCTTTLLPNHGFQWWIVRPNNERYLIAPPTNHTTHLRSQETQSGKSFSWACPLPQYDTQQQLHELCLTFVMGLNGRVWPYFVYVGRCFSSH